MLELEHSEKYVLERNETKTQDFVPFYYNGKVFPSFEEGYKYMCEFKSKKINEKAFSLSFDILKANIWYKMQKRKSQITVEMMSKCVNDCENAFFASLKEV